MQQHPEHIYYEANGIRLHAVLAGQEYGPLVVLLHGFPEFWYGWRNQIEPLAEAGLRVLALDQRGYNLSDKPKRLEAYNIGLLAMDVIAVIQAAGREKAFLVGHDWGAHVAWEVAIRYPKQVEKLAILNVAHPDVMTRFLLGNPEQIRKSWYVYFFQTPRLPDWALCRQDYSGLRNLLLRSSKEGVFNEADLERYVQAWSQPGAVSAMLNWYRAAFRRGLQGPKNPNRVPRRRVHVPTLILWGKQDVALSSRMVRPSASLCDNAKFVFFDQASHWLQHEEAEQVNYLLIDFFKNSQVSQT